MHFRKSFILQKQSTVSKNDFEVSYAKIQKGWDKMTAINREDSIEANCLRVTPLNLICSLPGWVWRQCKKWKYVEKSWWMESLRKSLSQNPWGLRPLGFWPWDCPRDSIHHDTPSAFPHIVPVLGSTLVFKPFFRELYIWGRCQKRGEGLANRFWSLLKFFFYCCVPLK